MNCIRKLRLLRNYKTYSKLNAIATNKCHENVIENKHKFLLSNSILNENYLLDEKNIDQINENIKKRKGVGDIYLVHKIKNELKNNNLTNKDKLKIKAELNEELKKIPNESHPDIENYGEEPEILAYYNEKPDFIHSPLEFSEICKKLNLFRNDHLGNFCGHKTYYFMNDLVELVTNIFSANCYN